MIGGFEYRGVDFRGRTVRGFEAVETTSDLAAVLKKRGITVISAKKVKNFKAARELGSRKGNKKVKLEELVVFSRQLSTMVEAGVTLVSALSILADQSENRNFQEVLEQVHDDVSSGAPLSSALAKHPKTFPLLFVSMIKAAEMSGELDRILDQLAAYMEARDKLIKKIKSATAYPRFIIIFFFAVLAAVVYGLVPKFQEIFESFGAELPVPTQIIIKISEIAKDNIIWEACIVIVTFVSIKRLAKTKRGRYFLDSLKLKLPVLGKVVMKSSVAKFCQTLSTLINAGVTIVDALQIASTTSGNVVYQDAIEDVKKGVTEGRSIHEKLAENQVFPGLMVQMIAVGEESGSLSRMLDKVSELYDSQVDAAISGLTSMIEPVLMIGLGIMALVVVVSLYLPIFKMSGVIQ